MLACSTAKESPRWWLVAECGMQSLEGRFTCLPWLEGETEQCDELSPFSSYPIGPRDGSESGALYRGTEVPFCPLKRSGAHPRPLLHSRPVAENAHSRVVTPPAPPRHRPTCRTYGPGPCSSHSPNPLVAGNGRGADRGDLVSTGLRTATANDPQQPSWRDGPRR